MKKLVIFKEDYKVAIRPQDGGGIIDAQKNDVVELPLYTADLVVNVKKKGEYYEPKVEESDIEGESEGEEPHPEGNKKTKSGLMGIFNPSTKDKDLSENT